MNADGTQPWPQAATPVDKVARGQADLLHAWARAKADVDHPV